jgi:hypothetical protein
MAEADDALRAVGLAGNEADFFRLLATLHPAEREGRRAA